MELFDLSEENELDTYTSREVPVLEGDEPQRLTQEELDQGVAVATVFPKFLNFEPPHDFNASLNCLDL